MKKARAFLIKHLFGRYWWKFPWQKHYNATDRGAFWSFNGYLILGFAGFFTGIELFYRLTIPWTLMVLYLGFPIGGLGYFSKFPVKWDELDMEQKWFFGTGAQSGQLTKKIEFTPDMMVEWQAINRFMKDKYNIK